MTSTSQPSDGKDKASLEPAKDTPPQEPKTVPLGEHIELRQKHRESEERIAKMEAELATLKNTPKVPADPKTPQIEELAKTLREIQNREMVNSVQGELGLTDPAAASKVVALMREKGLDAREALSIAAMREPQVFASKDRPTGGEPQFGSLTPRPGSSPQQKPDDTKLRKAYIESLRGKDERQRDRYLENQIGGHLAEAIGWHHDLLPLPPQP